MLKIETPDFFLSQQYKRIPYMVKLTFLSALVLGLMTHMYALTHNFLNLDSMWNLYSDQNMISSGRQFLMYACGISSFYSLPWLNGFLSVLFLALAAAAVSWAFDINTKAGAILTAAVMVTFPTIASTFCYMFTADGYMLAILLSAVAFLLCDRRKWGMFAGIVLLGISIGIYQAYLSFVLVLCVLRLFISLLEEDFKKIFSRIWHYGIMVIGGYAFYVITLKIMLAVQHVKMSGYQGTDKVGSFAFSEIPRGLYAAIRNTASFFIRANVLKENTLMLFTLLGCILSAVILYIVLFIFKKKYQSIQRVLMALLLIAMLPFCLSTIAIMSPDVFFHLLLRMPCALLFVFPIVLAEKSMEFHQKRLLRIMRPVACIFIGVMAFQFAIWSNVAYFNMNERYEKTYALSLRIADRLEQTEGYRTGMPVAILGGFPSQENYPSTEVTSDDLKGYFGASGDYCVDSTKKMAAFMSHYLNVTILTVSDSKEQELAASEEYGKMEKFPAVESIRQIDGVWVLKLQ